MTVIPFPQLKSENIPGFPAVKRRPKDALSDSDVAWIVRGGVTNKPGRPTHRETMSKQQARNWLTGAHAKGEITDAQLEMFWPGDSAPPAKEASAREGGEL